MKKLLLMLAFICCASATYAQEANFSTTVITNTGRPVAGATVAFCNHHALAPNPCTDYATIYSDVEGAHPITNPTKTDGYGNAFFFAAAGTYDYSVSGKGITTQTFRGATLSLPGGGGGGGTPATPFNSVQYNNAGVFGGTSLFTWDLLNLQFNVGGSIIGQTSGVADNGNSLSCSGSTNAGSTVDCLNINASNPLGGGSVQGINIAANANTGSGNTATGIVISAAGAGSNNGVALELGASSGSGNAVAEKIDTGSISLNGDQGTVGEALISQGPNAAPIWSMVPISGTISANQVGYGSGTNTLAGSSHLTFTNSTPQLYVNSTTAIGTIYGLDVVAGAGPTNFLGLYPVYRETDQHTGSGFAYLTRSETAASGSYFTEVLNDDGSYVLSNNGGTGAGGKSATFSFDHAGSFTATPFTTTGFCIGNSANSGKGCIGYPSSGLTPAPILLPTAIAGGSGYLFSSNGANPQVTSWIAPSSLAIGFGQITAATNSNAGTFALSGNTWDAHSATHTLPVVTGAIGAIPGTCTVGEVYFSTSATNGQNLYFCTSTNVFTQQLNSGAGGASAALSNLAAVAINTTLLPGAVNTIALGSNALPFTNLFLGTVANQSGSFNTANLTANRTINLPNATSTPVRDCPAVSNQFMTAEAVATGICSQATVGVSAYSPNAYIAGAGLVNVMTATMSPAATALTAGLRVSVLPNLANTTTTPTLNVNGLGPATITKFGAAVLVAGDYTTTAVADFIYDGTNWELQNPQSLATTITNSSVNTLTNKTLNAESTGNNLSEPVRAFFKGALCNNSTAAAALDLGTANDPTPNCAGTTVRKGTLQFARGNVAYINFRLPLDWNSSASTDIEISFTTTDTTNAHVTSFNVQTGCNKVDGTATDDPALNAAQALSVTTGASQVSGGELTGTLTAMTMTGCTADYNFEIAITRNNSGTDTNTDTAVAVKDAQLIFGVTKNAANR